MRINRMQARQKSSSAHCLARDSKVPERAALTASVAAAACTRPRAFRGVQAGSHFSLLLTHLWGIRQRFTEALRRAEDKPLCSFEALHP